MTRESKPALLWDVMDTLVRDPIHDVVPAFHGLSLPALFAAAQPGAWPRLEAGEIDDHEYARQAFRDRRAFDVAALRDAMAVAYDWLPGVEALLGELEVAGYEMHALSNYPDWYRLIEARLGVSRYVRWSFVSCDTRVRKPSPEAWLGAARVLGRPLSACVFIDDRDSNVQAARALGMPAIRFESADQTRRALAALGIP